MVGKFLDILYNWGACRTLDDEVKVGGLQSSLDINWHEIFVPRSIIVPMNENMCSMEFRHEYSHAVMFYTPMDTT